MSRCYVGERIARRVVRRRSGGWCEVCDRRRATEWHHRINRSQGGEWRAGNGLDTCSACHLHITTNPHAARQQGWHLYPGEHPAAMRVWLARRGWCLLSDAGDVTPVDNDPRYVHPW